MASLDRRPCKLVKIC